MRTLSATLEAAQQAYGEDTRVPYIDIQVGATHYYCASVLKVDNICQPWGDYCEIWIDNSDAALTTGLWGENVIVNLGFVTGAGNETSPYPPLQVRRQEFFSYEGRLICILYCYGLLDDMKERRASYAWSPGDVQANDSTVKELIAFHTTDYSPVDTPFGQYGDYNVQFDNDDAVIDVTMPGSSFHIAYNEPQANAINRLLDYTACVIRLEADGYPHVFEPTVTPSVVYDYTYKLSWDTVPGAEWADTHEFIFNKQQFNVTLPNYVVVENDDNDPDGHFEGFAQEATDVAKYGRVDYYWRFNNLTSDAEATALAEARLKRFQAQGGGHNAGYFVAPINVGLELYDYVGINDARSNQYNVGNIGYIRTIYEAGKYEQTIAFGKTQSGLPQPQDEPDAEADQRQLILPTWVINGALSASDDMQGPFMRAPCNCTMDWAMAAVASATTGADIIIEIWYFDDEDPWPGSMVWFNTANRLTIADGYNDGFSYLHNTGDLNTVRWGGFWYIKIKQVGSTTPGTTLTVTLCAIRTGRYVEKGSGETGSQPEAIASDEISAGDTYYWSPEWYASRPGLLGQTARGRYETPSQLSPQPISPFGILDSWSKWSNRNWK